MPRWLSPAEREICNLSVGGSNPSRGFLGKYMWYIYICPKRTYSCIKRMRGQQVYLRERIPNAMFVTLSTYFYVGARMLYYSRKDVVYTNADERRFNVSVSMKKGRLGLRF